MSGGFDRKEMEFWRRAGFGFDGERGGRLQERRGCHRSEMAEQEIFGDPFFLLIESGGILYFMFYREGLRCRGVLSSLGW